jgi:hypothetical protein
MKNWIAKYQKTIIGVGAISVLLICYYQQKELAKLRAETSKPHIIVGADSLNKKTIDSFVSITDSLYTENFFNKNVVGRYELSIQFLYEANPKAAKQFEDYFNNETE